MTAESRVLAGFAAFLAATALAADEKPAAQNGAADGKPALTAQAGWVVNALRDEYLAIRPDMPAMEQLAATTGGRVLTPAGLDEFVADLKNLPLPVKETHSEPLWNTSAWLIAALGCFIGEWSLRRWKKLP